MTEEQKAQQRLRYQKWAAKPGNGDKEKQRLRLLYQSRREEIKLRSRKWYADNEQRAKETKKRYLENPEHKQRAHERARSWAAANPERLQEMKDRWNREHPEVGRVAQHRRRARIYATDGSFTVSDVAKLYELQSGECAGCRADLSNGFEVDHVMPISRGGSNWPSNLQLLCVSCNRKKSAMHPDDWAARLGKLFV